MDPRDPERAAAGPFGAPIAHGYLTLSLVIPLFSDLLQINGISMGVNYGLDKLRFPAPVKVGSKIRLAGKVAKVEEVPGGVQMSVDFTMEVEGQQKPALVARGVKGSARSGMVASSSAWAAQAAASRSAASSRVAGCSANDSRM